MQENIIVHLKNLTIEFNLYYPECEDKSIYKLIRNPFIVNVSEMPDVIQEEVIEIQHDSNLKDIFKTDISLEVF